MDVEETSKIHSQLGCTSWLEPSAEDSTPHQTNIGNASNSLISPESRTTPPNNQEIETIFVKQEFVDIVKSENHCNLGLSDVGTKESWESQVKIEDVNYSVSENSGIQTVHQCSNLEKGKASNSLISPESRTTPPTNREIEMIFVKQEFEDIVKSENYCKLELSDVGEKESLDSQVMNENCEVNYSVSVNSGIKTVHQCSNLENAKPFVCTVCFYRCPSLNTLIMHMRIHRRKTKTLFVCSICDFKCKCNSSLKRHMRIHTGETPYECSVCNYKCKQSFNLKNHMRTHTGEAPFVCSICDFKFKQSYALKSHMRTHTGETPFVCSICDFKFKRQDYLKSHMRIHTGETPYVCLICDFKCKCNSNLKKHMRIHTGETPFVCSVCDFKYKSNISLKRHMRIHTGETP